MGNILKLGFVICLLIITSCSSTKSTTKNSSKDGNSNEEAIVENSNANNTTRDGSSFERAIIVKSVAEEYEYVKKVCSDCHVFSQTLTFEKNKAYDVLKIIKSNGEHISYYFDISEFYGKGF